MPTIRRTQAPNLIGQPSVDFDINGFEALIENKGLDVIIDRAIPCPCRGHSNSNLLNCQNCRGSGWLFINPIRTKVLMTSINNETQFKEWSLEKVGTVSVSLYNRDRITYMDRLTMMNDYSIFQEIKTLREFINEDDSVDRFIFLSYEIESVEEVFIFFSPTQKLIKLNSGDYSVRAENKYVLEFSYDFSAIPDFNNVISVRYKHKNQYNIIDLPHDLRRSFKRNSDGAAEKIELPINGIARKSHEVFNIPDFDGSGVLDNSYL